MLLSSLSDSYTALLCLAQAANLAFIQGVCSVCAAFLVATCIVKLTAVTLQCLHSCHLNSCDSISKEQD